MFVKSETEFILRNSTFAFDYLASKNLIGQDEKDIFMKKLIELCDEHKYCICNVKDYILIEFYYDHEDTRLSVDDIMSRVKTLMDHRPAMLGRYPKETKAFVRKILQCITYDYCNLRKDDLEENDSLEETKSRLYLEHEFNQDALIQVWFEKIYLKNKEKMDNLFEDIYAEMCTIQDHEDNWEWSAHTLFTNFIRASAQVTEEQYNNSYAVFA